MRWNSITKIVSIVQAILFMYFTEIHTQDVANIQAATIVNNPEKLTDLALFMYETYYPLSDETAVYATEEEANQAYDFYYGNTEREN